MAAWIAEKKKVQRPQQLSSDRSDNVRWDRKSCISVIATIAGKWLPYDRTDRWTFFFSAIAATVATIWKPGYSWLIYNNDKTLNYKKKNIKLQEKYLIIY